MDPQIIFTYSNGGRRFFSVRPFPSVCTRQIDIEIIDGVLTKVDFYGGCAGNTQAVASLLRGMRVEEAIKRLDGIDCNFRGTSCPDQLARALKYVMTEG